MYIVDKAKVMKVIFLIIIMQQTTHAQKKSEALDLSDERFTIENCVNSFDIDKAKKQKLVTNIGLLIRIF